MTTTAAAIGSHAGPDQIQEAALARWVEARWSSAAHRFALDRFWAQRLGIVSEAIIYDPWEAILSAPREPRLVAPVFDISRLTLNAPSLGFLAPIPAVRRTFPIEIDDLGSFWFTQAKQAFEQLQDDARQRRRSHVRGGVFPTVGIEAYHAEVQRLAKCVPEAVQDHWEALRLLAPANELAEKARRATAIMIQTAFERSVLGAPSDTRAFLEDEDAFAQAVFQSLRQRPA